MTTNATTNLGQVAVDLATRGAVEYLRRHDLKVTKAGMNDLVERIKAHVKTRLPEALADAKEALDVHMGLTAEQTFAVTMTLAGMDDSLRHPDRTPQGHFAVLCTLEIVYKAKTAGVPGRSFPLGSCSKSFVCGCLRHSHWSDSNRRPMLYEFRKSDYN